MGEVEVVGFGVFYPYPHKGRRLHVGMESYILGGEMDLRVDGAITGELIST